MIRVECHHSGGLIVSAIAAEEVPLFACILQTGLNRPAGKASLNSLCGNYMSSLTQAASRRTLVLNDPGDNEVQKLQVAFVDTSLAVASSKRH
jgi:hypothetical protein